MHPLALHPSLLLLSNPKRRNTSWGKFLYIYASQFLFTTDDTDFTDFICRMFLTIIRESVKSGKSVVLYHTCAI